MMKDNNMKAIKALKERMENGGSTFQGLHIGDVITPGILGLTDGDIGDLLGGSYNPNKTGDCLIRIPALSSSLEIPYIVLARRMSPLAGINATMFTPLSIGAEVIVAFIGTSSVPVILGCLNDMLPNIMPPDIMAADPTGQMQPFMLSLPNGGNKMIMTNGVSKTVAFGDATLMATPAGPVGGLASIRVDTIPVPEISLNVGPKASVGLPAVPTSVMVSALGVQIFSGGVPVLDVKPGMVNIIGNVTITGAVTVTGAITNTGSLTNTGALTNNGISTL